MVKDEYGLIGKKLGHSFSADFFNEKFHKEGIDASYSLFSMPEISDFSSLLSHHPLLRGLNVTIPYKQEVIPFLDALSEEASAIGAVNVIKISEKDGKKFLKGFNSDCIGFRESLLPFLQEDMKKALILGTGGASKAVKYVLENAGVEITFVSRKPKEGMLTYDELSKEIIDEHLLIVNTTPLGMYPDVEGYPPIPYQFLTRKHFCYDLIYNPPVTEFMKKSAKEGALVKNGLEMLILQALASWEIWSK